MRFFDKVRMLNRWSRALLVGFALVFGLNSIAHGAHQHETTSATTSLHSTVCGFCVSFDHLTTPPTHAVVRLSAEVESFAVAVSDAAHLAVRARSTAQPRAPPVS
jgi:Protein of unknown function (DUF2946)